MRSLLRSVKKRKKRVLGEVEVMSREEYTELDVDSKVEMIRALVPLGLMHVEELFDEEVKALAGERYARKEARLRGRRHGSNPGTVGLGGQRVPVRVPRVRSVAIFLDGKAFADALMVVALGVTLSGEKRFLGFVETDTENEQVLTPFLRSLMERGLDISEGVLVIVDGGKGLRAAVKKAFRNRALVQRCQWHKRENVVRYLSKTEQAVWRRRLQRA